MTSEHNNYLWAVSISVCCQSSTKQHTCAPLLCSARWSRYLTFLWGGGYASLSCHGGVLSRHQNLTRYVIIQGKVIITRKYIWKKKLRRTSWNLQLAVLHSVVFCKLASHTYNTQVRTHRHRTGGEGESMEGYKKLKQTIKCRKKLLNVEKNGYTVTQALTSTTIARVYSSHIFCTGKKQKKRYESNISFSISHYSPNKIASYQK